MSHIPFNILVLAGLGSMTEPLVVPAQTAIDRNWSSKNTLSQKGKRRRAKWSNKR